METATNLLTGFGHWFGKYLPALIIFGFWGGIFWLKLRRKLSTQRKEAEGGIGRASFFQPGDMPVHYNFVAQIGTQGPAATGVAEKVLRPAIGVRLVVLFVSGLLIYYCTKEAFWQVEFSALDQGTEWVFQAARVIIPIGAIYGILYVFTSEARYDHEVLITSRMLLFRHEFRWTDLQRIGDGGAYDLVLFFQPGGKAKVLKHSAGIGEFKEFALAQIRKNKAAHA